jgi:hypothetical protein
MNSCPSGKPRSGVLIAAHLGLPVETYYSSIDFRSNLPALEFRTELANASRGVAISHLRQTVRLPRDRPRFPHNFAH